MNSSTKRILSTIAIVIASVAFGILVSADLGLMRTSNAQTGTSVSTTAGNVPAVTIPSFADPADEEFHARDDRDFSHITMRTRAWWHETFLAAGWRQDALHRTLERACQAHELPRRMNWQVYVYAPR